MRRYLPTVSRLRWGALAIALTSVVSLIVATSGAQAVVVNDQGAYAGVSLTPSNSVPAAMAVPLSGQCSDPWLSADLSYQGILHNLPPNALCYQGGAVMHSNETFALTWDPNRAYWSTTRDYVEQFLRDIADGSGSFGSPFAVTTQYHDASAHAANSSKYGGGCIDYGSGGGSNCQIGTGTSQGHNYPGTNGMGSCWVSGSTPCVTDGDIRSEVSTIASATQPAQPGYTPLVVVLTPPGVAVCLDSTNTLCSANNSTSTAQFCSYHAQVGGLAYVVQPWTSHTSCDEPNLPQLPPNPTPQQLAVDAGSRLVNPLSQAQLAAIVNPGVTDGWIASSNAPSSNDLEFEINDNWSCTMGGPQADTVSIGSGSYVLRRTFNNAAAIESDPNTYFGCAPDVILSPAFVVPSAVNAGDLVEFDGSASASTLIVPNASYQWDFGDGTGGSGPSVEHIYSKGGNYNVKLTVTDRGGNVATLQQTISVLGANGLPVPPSPAPTTNAGSTASGLKVRLQLRPQSLRNVLRSGIAVQVSSNEPANGLATVSISRAAARRLHIKVGRGRSVAIGRGTVSAIKDGTITLHFRLSQSTATKLKGLRHVALTIRLVLVAGGQDHLAVVAAGRY